MSYTGHRDGRLVGAWCSEADTPGGTGCGTAAARLTIFKKLYEICLLNGQISTG